MSEVTDEPVHAHTPTAMSFREWVIRPLARLFRTGPSVHGGDVSSVYRKLLSPCPVCGKPVDGHSYWKMASVIANEASDAPATVARLVSERRWREAARVMQWAHDADVREYYAIRCPNSDRLGLVTVLFTHEFWSNDVIEEARALPDQDTRELSELVGDRWTTL